MAITIFRTRRAEAPLPAALGGASRLSRRSDWVATGAASWVASPRSSRMSSHGGRRSRRFWIGARPSADPTANQVSPAAFTPTPRTPTTGAPAPGAMGSTVLTPPGRCPMRRPQRLDHTVLPGFRPSSAHADPHELASLSRGPPRRVAVSVRGGPPSPPQHMSQPAASGVVRDCSRTYASAPPRHILGPSSRQAAPHDNQKAPPDADLRPRYRAASCAARLCPQPPCSFRVP